MNLLKYIYIFAGVLILSVFSGCGTAWLDEQPLESLSTSSFWSSPEDVTLALAGIYWAGNVGTNAYTNEVLCMSSATDDSGYKHGAIDNIYSGYFKPGDTQVVQAIWNRAYVAIFRANYFPENIGKVEMDAIKKAEAIAEVTFLRT